MRIKSTRLEWCSRDHSRDNILVLDNNAISFCLIDRIFAHTGRKSNRLTITKHKYFYAPSEEYKQFVVRFKRTK